MGATEEERNTYNAKTKSRQPISTSSTERSASQHCFVATLHMRISGYHHCVTLVAGYETFLRDTSCPVAFPVCTAAASLALVYSRVAL